ncbi:hypothetical protein OG21DRAFT_1507397 [Imleria badia]|nr:hypothetical protein OG21DRAFT_1507397 [Imleria badia]
MTEPRLECHSEAEYFIDDYALLSSLLAESFSISEDRTLSSSTVRSFIIHSVHGGATLTLSTSERNCDYFDSAVSCQYSQDQTSLGLIKVEERQ